MKIIPLTKGYSAIVDDEDFENLNTFSWCVQDGAAKSNLYYAMTTINHKTIMMHRMLMGFPRKRDVDHKNNNGLDNRKENLQICTHRENLTKRKKKKGTSSQYKGLSWHKQMKKWQVCIGKKYIGLFENEKEAAEMYNKYAKKIYGSFCYLNF